MTKEIAVQHLNVSYYGKRVIEDVSFRFSSGNLIGIIGPNGAGKSTLIKAMLGLIPKDSGDIMVEQQPINNRRKDIAYVPQRSNIDWDFPIVVKDTVLLGTYPKLGLFHRPKKADKEWAMECLSLVGMAKYAKSQIGELSGGQQQRVFLARALAQKADYFFLDEPFVGIDASSEEVIINILRKMRDQGKMIFVVHHDLTKVEAYFDELVILNKLLVGAGPVKDVFQKDMMQKAYQAPYSLMGSLGVDM